MKIPSSTAGLIVLAASLGFGPAAAALSAQEAQEAQGAPAAAAAATGAAATAAAATAAPLGIPQARNAVYLELLGNGLIYSINYDRRVTGSMGFRAGLGALGVAGTVPVTFNYLAGGTRHHLDLGIGPLLVFGVQEVEDEAGEVIDRTSGAALLGTGTFGYRFQPDTGGFVFRIGLTPLFSAAGIIPWFGLSLGYAF